MSEDIHIETMDEVYEVMRDNLANTFTKLTDTIQDIEDNKKPSYEVINDILRFCTITYSTLDAMLQIQLGIIKDKEHRK